MMIRSTILPLMLAGAAAQGQAQTQTHPQTQTQTGAPSQTAVKLVCKSREVTGSLVKKRKVCQQQVTWEKQSDSYKDQWSALQGTHGSTNGN